MDESEGIEGLVIRRERSLGRITLDRPKALNALTLTMVRGLATTLKRWASDPQISVIVLDGAGDRAFCAGGDIKSLYEADRSDGNQHARMFWREEYPVDHLIATYPKPIVVLMSGIVMGGGAGLAVNARFRVVDETANFTMPETGIGMLPDVGGSWFLSRMPGETGTYLALTGRTIDAGAMITGGLADVFVPRRDRARLLDTLDEVTSAGAEAFAAVAAALSDCASDPGPGLIADHINLDRLFAGDSVEAILDRLAEDGGEWAQRTAQLMLGRSPTCQKLALTALRRARHLPDLAAALTMEYRVVCRIAESHDFYEGIRAAVVDKDRSPNWQPARLADVSRAEVAAYFAPLGDDELKV
jgi:enoyl-CoA hydratase